MLYNKNRIRYRPVRLKSIVDQPAVSPTDVSIINCGSVGQPRDGDPRAAYMLLDTEKRTFRHVRVDYDVAAAAEAIRAAGLPEHLAGRLFLGK